MFRPHRLVHRAAFTTLVGLASLVTGPSAYAGQLTFEGLTHGAVISTRDNQGGAATYSGFALPSGLAAIEVNNSKRNVGSTNDAPDLGVAFDSNATATNDPDLQWKQSGTGTDVNDWTSGNLRGTGTNLGFLAIIQERSAGCGGGVCDQPDDEGTRPAGSLILDFDVALDSIGFDLIDVEGPEYGGNAGSVAVFRNGGSEVGRVGFGEFIDPSSSFYDSTVAFGNNSANRIEPIAAAQLGISAFDEVEFNFGGSMAIDNVMWTTVTVPEPGTLALMLVGLGGALRRHRHPTRSRA